MALETHKRLSYLDGWRGVAIGLVLLGHFWLDHYIPRSSVVGVDLFFVLSGRLMAEILFVQQTPLRTFFVRRFSRVYPALLAFVMVAALAFAFTPYKVGLLAAISALTFTINYAIIYVHPTGIFDHLWSLCVEEHGYMILALVALATRRRYALATAVLFGAGAGAMANGIVQNAVTGAWFVDVSWRTDVQIAPLFLAGAMYLALRKRPSLQVPWLSPLCFVMGLIAKLGFSSVIVQFGLGTLFFAISVATIDSAAGFAKRILEPPMLRQLGLWSFSLYLWQQPFYQMTASGDVGPLPMIAAAVVCGLISFYAVEGPARRYINRYGSRRDVKPVTLT